jgi:dethiobiotin synthetase
MKASQQRRLVFVTGSDTGVGKTVLTAAFTRHLRAAGVNAVALKPLCSGGRDDARALRAAADDALALDEANPWHFRAALAPTLAARREKRRVTLPVVAARVRAVARRFELASVEGAGGLLSPLTEDGDNRDLLAALQPGAVLIVVPNRLGAVNQARLVLAALPKIARRRTAIVLFEQRKPDAASRTNAALLAEFAPGVPVVRLPWLASGRITPRAVAALDALAAFALADG